jgi:hypothetical protein
MASGVFSIRQQAQAAGHGAWAGSQTTPYVEYLVVAGGGGAGADGPGGGGAGGLLTGMAPVVAGTSYTVTVGGGGSGVSSGQPTNGSNSVFGAITTIGGGNGANGSNAGGSGGSGGGAGILYTGYNQAAGQGTAGQGNAGGKLTTAAYSGGGASSGGGGAGTVGITPAVYNAGGNGGAGIASAISGTVTAYAGGGGGATGNTGGGFTASAGGVGGGGAGGIGSNGTSGTANTGGGGGAGQTYTGGGGGSGIVIISYPDTYNAPTSFGGANSPTSSTSGSGSMYGNGSGSLLYTGVNTALSFAGNFTIEGWYNLANFSNAAGGGNPGLIGYGTSNWVLVLPGGTYTFYSAGSVILSSSAVASANVWNHFALVRSGSTLTIYHNGTSVGTATNSSTISIGSSGVTVGSNGLSGVGSITGYMSNVRVVNGTAVYTSNFTPSTAPLTAITNTQLLLTTVSPNQYLDSSSNGFTPTVASALTWNQASPFATGLGYKNRVYTWTASGTVTF